MEKQICIVCQLLDKDESLKECEYCKVCRSWICLADQTQIRRRTRAMAIKHGFSVRHTVQAPFGGIKPCGGCGDKGKG